MADVCKLEKTEMVKGIDMAEYWKSTFAKEFSFAIPDTYGRSCLEVYFKEEWRESDLKRAIAHGCIVALSLGVAAIDRTGLWVFTDDNLLACRLMMFGIREKEVSDYNGELLRASTEVVPPRNQRYCTSEEDTCMSSVIIDCFGELPSYLPMAYLEEDTCSELVSCMPQFKYLRYLSLHCRKYGPNIQHLLVRIVREAANLEVLCLKYDPQIDEDGTEMESPSKFGQSLDQMISELSESPFMATMRVLASYYFTGDPDLHMEWGLLSITYKTFKKFVDSFLKIATTHRQVVRLEGTVIACENVQELRELLDLKYPLNKVIELYKCKFSIDDSTL